MISTRKIFINHDHVNLRHLHTIELSATDSLAYTLAILQATRNVLPQKTIY